MNKLAHLSAPPSVCPFVCPFVWLAKRRREGALSARRPQLSRPQLSLPLHLRGGRASAGRHSPPLATTRLHLPPFASIRRPLRPLFARMAASSSAAPSPPELSWRPRRPDYDQTLPPTSTSIHQARCSSCRLWALFFQPADCKRAPLGRRKCRLALGVRFLTRPLDARRLSAALAALLARRLERQTARRSTETAGQRRPPSHGSRVDKWAPSAVGGVCAVCWQASEPARSPDRQTR